MGKASVVTFSKSKTVFLGIGSMSHLSDSQTHRSTVLNPKYFYCLLVSFFQLDLFNNLSPSIVLGRTAWLKEGEGFLGGDGVVWRGCGDGGDGDYEGFLGGGTWFEVVLVVRVW